MAYTLLSKINPSSRQWIICVRISRRWHYRRGTDTGPIDHTDLILLDEQVLLKFTSKRFSISYLLRCLLSSGAITVFTRLPNSLFVQGNHIYAEVSADNVSKFESLLEEGRVYELRKFLVAPTKSSFKPVRAPFMIWFTKHTVVEEKTDASINFPMRTYDLTPFTKIPSLLAHLNTLSVSTVASKAPFHYSFHCVTVCPVTHSASLLFSMR